MSWDERLLRKQTKGKYLFDEITDSLFKNYRNKKYEDNLKILRETLSSV